MKILSSIIFQKPCCFTLPIENYNPSGIYLYGVDMGKKIFFPRKYPISPVSRIEKQSFPYYFQ